MLAVQDKAKGNPSRTTRLAVLAAPLKPDRAPWYVWRNDVAPTLRRHFPADGWYWVPQGHGIAIYLAATYEDAVYELRTILEREAATA